MPSHSPPQRRDAAENRARLLSNAARLITREGPDVPMARIADEACIGIGTIYRNFTSRKDLLATLEERSYELILGLLTDAVEHADDAVAGIVGYLHGCVAARHQLVLPLIGGPVATDPGAVAIRAEIGATAARLLARGEEEGSVRDDLGPVDLIAFATMITQGLPYVEDWEGLARRQVAVFVAGIRPGATVPLPGDRIGYDAVERRYPGDADF